MVKYYLSEGVRESRQLEVRRLPLKTTHAAGFVSALVFDKDGGKGHK